MTDDWIVTVWQVDLDACRRHLPAHLHLLSSDELGRAKRFRSAVHRDWFIACRVALRLVLGARLAMRPGRLRFRYGPSGKPELGSVPTGIRFNVSHTHGRALIAVASRFDIGVDIEREAPVPDWKGLSALVFSDQERRALAEAGDKPGAFLRVWTRKEAVLKALGIGLSGSPADLTVSLGHEPAIITNLAEGGSPSDWTLVDLSGTVGVAALAARVPGASVRLRKMDLRCDG